MFPITSMKDDAFFHFHLTHTRGPSLPPESMLDWLVGFVLKFLINKDDGIISAIGRDILVVCLTMLDLQFIPMRL